MPVAIRLSRIGTKSKPFYRMVILDSRKKRDGACLENIGTYNGLTGEFIVFKPERFDAWVAQGAQPSDTAKRLYRQYKSKNKTVEAGSKPAAKITVKKAKTQSEPEEQKQKTSDTAKAA